MNLTLAEEHRQVGTSTFRGHPIVWRNGMWVYADNGNPIPGWGGEVRPCIVCGQQEWSGDGAVDMCLGLLPGVSNACCGHGDPSNSYIRFTNGVVIRGFSVVESIEQAVLQSPEIQALKKDAERYRWLRDSGNDDISVVSGLGCTDSGSSNVVGTYEYILDGEQLDSAIDHAMSVGGENNDTSF